MPFSPPRAAHYQRSFFRVPRHLPVETGATHLPVPQTSIIQTPLQFNPRTPSPKLCPKMTGCLLVKEVDCIFRFSKARFSAQ